jgi:hypothetical protein
LAALLQEQREKLEATYDAVTVDLERERQLNTSMREAAAVQEALKEQKDAAVGVLEAAAGADSAGQQTRQTQVCYCRRGQGMGRSRS